MKRIITLLSITLTMLLVIPKAYAQHLRFELGTNYTMGMGDFVSEDSGVGAYGTLHLMLPFSPISVGATVSYEDYTIYRAVDGGDTELDGKGFAVYPHATYTFKGCKYFVPYLGLGAGLSYDNVGDSPFDDGAQRNFALVPMAGVRFVNHIKLSMRYTILPDDYSRLSLNLGLIF